MELRKNLFYLAFALMARRGEEGVLVGRSEMRREKADRRERQRAVRKHLQEHRELSRGSRRSDPSKGGML